MEFGKFLRPHFGSNCDGRLETSKKPVESKALGRTGEKRHIECTGCDFCMESITIWQENEKGTGFPKKQLDKLKVTTGILELSLRNIPDQWNDLVGEEVREQAEEALLNLYDRLTLNLIE